MSADTPSGQSTSADAGTSPAPRRRGISIRTRLIAAFGAMVAVTLVATGGAVYFMERVTAILEGLVDDTMPAVSAANQLATTSGQIAATGPAVLAAESQGARRDRMAVMELHVRQAQAPLESLRETGFAESVVASVGDQLGEMQANLDALDTAVAERLAVTETVNQRLERANAAYDRFQREAEPAYIQALAAIRADAEATTTALDRTVQTFLDETVSLHEVFADLHGSAQAAVLSLTQAAAAPSDQAGLVRQRAAFAAQMRSLEDTLIREFPGSSAVAEIRDKLDRLRQEVAGEQGLFDTLSSLVADDGTGEALDPARWAALNDEVAGVVNRFQAVFTTLDSFSESEVARLAGQARAVRADAQGELDRLLETELGQISDLTMLRLHAARMIASLNWAANAEGGDALAQQQDAYRRHYGQAFLLLAELNKAGDGLAEGLRQPLHQLGRAGFSGAPAPLLGGEGRDGRAEQASDGQPGASVFAARRNALAAGDRAQDLVDENRVIADSLTGDVRAIVRLASVEADRATEQAGSLEDTGRIALAGIAVFTVGLATLVGWIYVGRSVVARLEALNIAMGRIAQGELDAPIPYRGDDEITAMADRLLVFRDNARRLVDANQQIREAEERYALAIRGSSDGIWDWDRVGERMYFSPRWAELLGYSPGELSESPQEWWRRVHPDDRESFGQALNAHLAGETDIFQAEHRMRCRDGSWRWMMGRGMAVFDESGWAVRMAGSLADVHERRLSEEQLRRRALYDDLTGLPNRALFLDRVQRAMHRYSREVTAGAAVLFVDLDRFKVVNDSLGHHAGDELIVELSKRLMGCVRVTDTVARMGGDEFVVLVEGADIETLANRVAERIKRALSHPVVLQGREVFTTASIGIAVAGADHEDPAELLSDADAAMYQAKDSGRDRVAIFSQSLRHRVLHTLELDSALRRGLESDEIVPYFQPIVDLKSGEIAGFEALARWHSRDQGLISPGEFIPLAEQTGLIAQIGQRILRQALVCLRNWQAFDPRLYVTVNVTPQQWLEHNFLREVEQALKVNDLEPRHLRLEITESGIMRDTEKVSEVLRDAAEMGVEQLIDDFGTGQSSLAELLRMPVTGLKIDKSFIHQRGGTALHQPAFVRTIMGLANASNMYVVSEGVETKTQRQQLMAMGSAYAQGYYFAKPMPVQDVEDMLVQRLEDGRPLGDISESA